MRIPTRVVASLLGLSLACALGPAAGAGEPTPAEKAVAEALSNPAKVAPAKEAVADAIKADPKAVLPRLLEARLFLLEGKPKKGPERATALALALDSLAKATENDRWDPEPFVLKLDVLEAMGNGDQALRAETLRAVAIRKPGDAAAREAYQRQTGKVPALAEGDPLPRVTWKDAAGLEVTSASLWAKGPVIIELYRSAVWCPYCERQLMALHGAADKFEAEGIAVVGCSPDTGATLATILKDGLKGKKPFRLRLLSDPQGQTADALGFLNPDTVKPGVRPEAFGLPHPTTIIVDNRGFVRFLKSHGDFRERVSPDEMLAVARRLRIETTPTK